MKSYNLAELAVTLFEEAGDALVLSDPDTEEILEVNPTAQRLSGFTRQELLRMHASYLFRSEEQGGLARLRHAFRNTEVFHAEEGFLLRNRKEGVWIPLNLTLARLHVRPRTLGLITARDVHEQRDAHTLLRKAEERLRTVVTNAPVILFALDRAGVFTFTEGKGLAELNIAPDELIGKSVFEVYGKSPQLIRNVRRVLAGEATSEVIEVEHGPGAGRFFETHYTPLRDRQRQMTGAIGVALDITDRRRAEQALRESEAFYHALVENLPQNILRKDLHGRFTFANWRACATLVKSLQDIVGRTDHDLFPAHLADKYRHDDVHVQTTGETLEMIEEHVTPQGESMYVQIIKTPLYDGGRGLIGTQVIFWDVTRQKRAEDRLRQSEERFRLLVEGVKDYAIFLLDPGGQVMSWNAGAVRIKGYAAAEIVGQRMSLFDPPEEAQTGKSAAALERAAREGRHEDEGWRLRKDGSRFWANVITTALRDDAGRLKGYSIIVRDLTERMRIEEAERTLRAHEVESNVARQIQRKLFPPAAPHVPGFDLAGVSYSAVATGGDYFDYIPMLDDGLGIVIGDAAGHGAGPALLMASTRAYLRASALTHRDVGTILTLANRVLAADVGDRFVTLILARLDPVSRSLAYVSAGHHPHGYVLAADGRVKQFLKSTSFPLGVVPDANYLPAPPFTLGPGESVLLLTDGIVEAVSAAGEAFGIDRALAVVRANLGGSAQDAVAALYTAVCNFCIGNPPLDDITAVLLKADAARFRRGRLDNIPCARHDKTRPPVLPPLAA